MFTTLPFRLPNSFIKFLASFAASRVNILPNKSGLAECPKSFFCGFKLEFRKEMRGMFGDYVQAYNPYVALASRTDSCILLHPAGNMDGSYKMYSIKSTKVISRDK